jgi:hypothetical protein
MTTWTNFMKPSTFGSSFTWKDLVGEHVKEKQDLEFEWEHDD